MNACEYALMIARAELRGQPRAAQHLLDEARQLDNDVSVLEHAQLQQIARMCKDFVEGRLY